MEVNVFVVASRKVVGAGADIAVACWTMSLLSVHLKFIVVDPVGTAAPKHFIVYRYLAGSSIVYFDFSLTADIEERSRYYHFEDNERAPLSFS